MNREPIFPTLLVADHLVRRHSMPDLRHLLRRCHCPDFIKKFRRNPTESGEACSIDPVVVSEQSNHRRKEFCRKAS